MTITRIFLLLLCAFILVLVLSTIFKRYHRIIMWSAAIVFFIGTLLLIGLGIIDPVKDNHPDPVVITGIFTALIFRNALDALPNIGERSGQLFDFPEDLRDIGQIGLCILVRAGIAACLRAVHGQSWR